MIAGIDNLRSISYSFNNSSGVSSIRVVTMIMDYKIRIGIPDGFYEFANSLGSSQSSVIFYGEQDIRTGYFQNFSDFFYIILVSMFRSGRETN
ncbi:MAG: hypothetical protein A4E66_01946 [Syntrophus sp. PtaB.Bin001]|nr:MAG: hypothetical protein A4E66_01946 [Syntrophus sp. PtaB.Bin001]